MKKHMISTACLAMASMALLTACSEEAPVITDRDLANSTELITSTDAAQQNLFYKPAVGYVADPMPFYDPREGDFKILYLQEYRPNQAVTYHPFWCVSTKDATSYTSLGELIPTGAASELDAALGTGSTIYSDGVYYTFYTAHSPNSAATAGINEAVMLATSTDFIHWEKNRTLLITAGERYSSSDFRDPFVFKGEDGIFHMLVATRENGKGVLAEFTSTDLLSWTDAGVFMTMMWDRFYECPDLFKMGDWWYLVYSEQHDAVRRVQYFKGHTLEELKACTANDAGLWPDNHEGFLDSRGLYAAKTASDGTNRYIWGWNPTRSGNANLGSYDWAGNLVAHKIIQHEDGTLTLGEVPALPGFFGEGKHYDNFTLEGDSFKLMPRLGDVNRIHFHVSASSDWDKFGVSFVRGGDSEVFYSLIVNPESDTLRKINFEEEGGQGFIGNSDGYVFTTPKDGEYDITIVTDNSVVTMYINDCAAYTGRIYGTGRNCWSINSYGAQIEISDLSVATK